jgi:hypothetical protein
MKRFFTVSIPIYAVFFISTEYFSSEKVENKLGFSFWLVMLLMFVIFHVVRSMLFSFKEKDDDKFL